MCPGVATTRTSRPPTATTSPSPSPSEPSRYDGSSARTPQPTRSAKARAASEWSRWWWVSRTTATSPAAARDRVEVGGVRRPGVDHDRPRRARLAQHPGVGAVERHRRWRWGRARTARPTPNDPPAQAHREPWPRPAAAQPRAGSTASPSSPDPSTLGREHLDRPASAAAASTSAGEACCATSRQVRYVGGSITSSPASTASHAAAAPAARSPTTTRSTRRGCSWPVGQRGDEEPRAEAARLEDRRAPARPHAEQVGAQHQARGGRGTSVNASSRASRACRSASQSSPVVSATTVVRRRPGEQHAGLLERLPHGGAHQRPRHLLVVAEPVAHSAARGPGPGDGAVEVARVDAAAGEDAHARRRTPSRSAAAAGRPPGPRSRRRSSTTVAASRGSAGSATRRRTRARARPAAAAAASRAHRDVRPRRGARPRRARPAAARVRRRRSARARPASPKTSPSSSEAPLATCGWPVKSGVDATKHDDLDDPLDRDEVADLGLHRGDRVERALLRARDGLLRR